MREFCDPESALFKGLFGSSRPELVASRETKGARQQLASQFEKGGDRTRTSGATSVTKDGDEPARKPERVQGISSQRSILLTAGTAVGQSVRRKLLLGVS